MIRIPAVQPGTGGAASTAVITVTAPAQFVIAGSPVTNTGTVSIALQTSTVAAGTYGNATAVAQIAVNAFGQVTSASAVNITFPAANTAVVSITAPAQFVIAGSPFTNTGTISIALQTSTVAAGTYGSASQVPVVTFNSFGQATAVSTATIVAAKYSWAQSLGNTTPTGTATSYVIFGFNTLAVSEPTRQITVPQLTEFSGFSVTSAGAVSATSSVICTMRFNAATSALSVTFGAGTTASATIINSTVTITATAGTLVSMEIASAAIAPAFKSFGVSLK